MNSADGAVRFLTIRLLQNKKPTTKSASMMIPPITPPAIGPALLLLIFVATDGLEVEDAMGGRGTDPESVIAGPDGAALPFSCVCGEAEGVPEPGGLEDLSGVELASLVGEASVPEEDGGGASSGDEGLFACGLGEGDIEDAGGRVGEGEGCGSGVGVGVSLACDVC